METDLLLAPAALRVELATAVADSPRAMLLLTEIKDVANARGHELTSFIDAVNDFLSTHRAAPRSVRLYLINLRHALTVRREADELDNNPAARKNLSVVAERLARKAQSGFSTFNLSDDLVTKIMQATAQ